MMHIGQGLVCGSKIQDLVKAGFQFTIFLADYHSMINNKYGGDLEKIRTTGNYFRHCFTALGIRSDSVNYVWASDLAKESDYWERVLRIARTTTTQRIMRATPIMGREMQSKDSDAAAIFYPCMQAADIFQMKIDTACAGIDQRKAHVLAREAGEKLGWGKPISLHTPLLMGLHGVPKTSQENYDEDPKLNQVIAAKMSKSKPENNILIHDEPEVIDRKVQQAFCPAQVVDGNPILEYFRIVEFLDRDSLSIEREPRFGGKTQFTSYNQLEKEYVAGKIHPKDLKTNMSHILSKKLAPVREYFRKYPEPLEAMSQLNAS